MNTPIYMTDIEIFQMASFIDVLEVIEKYNSIDEVKKDIRIRKRYIQKEIKDLQNIKHKRTYYEKDSVIEILRRIEICLKKNEWSYAKEYLEIMLNKMSESVENCDEKFLKKNVENCIIFPGGENGKNKNSNRN